jgi:condensin complex subunit 3
LFASWWQRADETDINNDDTQPAVRIGRSLPKPMQEMTPEERAQADAIDLRCLSLCIGMLERVHGVRMVHVFSNFGS